MPDERFFHAPEPVRLSSLASKFSLEYKGDDKLVYSVAPLHEAAPQDLAFFDNVKYRMAFQTTRAGTCIVRPGFAQEAPDHLSLILSHTPYKTYALIASYLYPQRKPDPYISDKAYLHRSVTIGGGCVIEPGAVLEEGVVLEENCHICANATLGRNVMIGKGSRVGQGASVSHALIGENVTIYPGVRIGQDGFGFAPDPAGFVKVPQLGRVIIKDGVEIGANTCIDRGAGPDTVIGAGTWIDNLVQIGHNVTIGSNCIIVSQCGISGSSILEDYAVLGGQVGVAGHLRIGKAAKIAAQSGVMRNVPPGEEYMGTPCVPIRTFMKQVALLKKMVNNKKSGN